MHNRGMIYGYARVSTDGQSVNAQIRQLRAAGASKVFREVASGAKTELIRDAQEAAGEKGVKLDVMKVGEEGEIAAAFASLVQLGAGGPSSTPIRSFRADEGKSWRRHRATDMTL